MIVKQNILLFISALTLFSCQESLPPKEYVAWVEDEGNGLRLSKNVGEIKYLLQYRPLEYVFAKEKRQESLDDDELKLRMEKLKGAQYYLLRISKAEGNEDIFLHNISGEQDYYERVSYCNAAMAEDIHLLQGKDTLNCNLFQYVPNYGVAPYADFVMAFDNVSNEEDKVFVYNDKLFGAGDIQFTIKNNTIKNIPELITK